MVSTAQRTEGSQVARIDLIPRTPRFREDQFRDLFKEESPRNTRTTEPPQERCEERSCHIASVLKDTEGDEGQRIER